jgi:hypothetical protein
MCCAMTNRSQERWKQPVRSSTCSCGSSGRAAGKQRHTQLSKDTRSSCKLRSCRNGRSSATAASGALPCCRMTCRMLVLLKAAAAWRPSALAALIAAGCVKHNCCTWALKMLCQVLHTSLALSTSARFKYPGRTCTCGSRRRGDASGSILAPACCRAGWCVGAL